jgi:ABC-type glutathione transport system ATPase component
VFRGTGLSKRFPGMTGPAVDKVYIAVETGDSVAVVGPSGCGKSTLLRLLAGLITPDSGCVALDGVQMPSRGNRLERRAWHRHVLLLPQDTARTFNPVLRLGTQFRAALRLHRIGASLDEAPGKPRAPTMLVRNRATVRPDFIAAAMLKRCGVSAEVLGRYPDQLSGGQRQRAALARVLCLRPSVLLLDEPSAALDPATTSELLALLGDLQREYRFAVITATHDAHVVSHTRRVYRMAHGTLSDSPASAAICR